MSAKIISFEEAAKYCRAAALYEEGTALSAIAKHKLESGHPAENELARLEAVVLQLEAADGC